MKITPHDVKQLASAPGGHRFTAFVDTLIRTEASIQNIARTDIRTNLKTNVGDKGVDTRIKIAIKSERSQWMDYPTIWQYKATNYGDITPDLEKEIRKKHSKACIVMGYAYRLAVCDPMPDATIEAWNKRLTIEAHRINPAAPAAMTIHADDLADWANEYPALLMRYFHPNLPSLCVHMDAWKQSIQSETPRYLSIPENLDLSTAIREHTDFAFAPSDVILAIIGESGVGKTRLVFEALQNRQLEGLVVYSEDEASVRQIAHLAASSDNNCKMIIVADESTSASRESLRRVLRGFSDRIRVVAIESTGSKQIDLNPHFKVNRPTLIQLERILEDNFPAVATERRNAYAKLCERFIQPAADLCKYDGKLGVPTFGAPATVTIRDYFHFRLNDAERIVLQALSLFSKVGFSGDYAHELEQVCKLLNLDLKEVSKTAKKIHDTPGYIKRTGRYYSVAPSIITQMAFDEAWNQWIAPDPPDFFNRIPADLVQAFINNASHASGENRKISGDFFRKWASSVTAAQLGDIDTMGRMAALAAMDPENYLPTLTRIIVECSDDEIHNMSNKRSQGWPSRRKLIFFLVRMASFENTFDIVEPALFRLAQCETEINIGNNSRKEWGRLFHIVLSGSPEPFLARFNRFKQRFLEAYSSDQSLVIETLSDLLTRHHSSMQKDIVLGGRIAPPEWTPKTNGEYFACYKSMFEFLNELHQRTEMRLDAAALVIRKTNLILQLRCFELYRAILEPELADTATAAKVMKAVDEFLFIHRDENKGDASFPAYMESIRNWVASKRPQDFHGRLVSMVGENQWNHLHLDMATVEVEYLKLAEELLVDIPLFENELSWLLSPEAHGAFQLGHQLGKIDTDAICLDRVISHLESDSRTGFVAGYVLGLTSTSSKHNYKINTILDVLESNLPVVAFAIFSISREVTSGFKRALRLIKEEKLELYYLQSFALGVPMADFSMVEMRDALNLIVQRAIAGDERAPEIGINFLAAAGSSGEIELKARRLIEPEIEALVWEFLELPITRQKAGREAYWWKPILTVLIKRDCVRATALLADSLVSGDLAIEEVASPLLIELAQSQPTVVLKELKRLMTTEDKEWRFLFKNYKALFAAFDPKILSDWLELNGIEIARRTARHLARPYIDDNNKPIVPIATEFALEKFGSDEGFFQEFAAGSNSGEVFVGDPATRSDAEAEIAKRFLNHRLKVVRDWAQAEFDSATSQAKYWREFQEEMDFS